MQKYQSNSIPDLVVTIQNEQPFHVKQEIDDPEYVSPCETVSMKSEGKKQMDLHLSPTKNKITQLTRTTDPSTSEMRKTKDSSKYHRYRM